MEAIKGFRGKYAFLSNFSALPEDATAIHPALGYPHPIRTAEHLYQAFKTMYVPQVLEILECESPGRAKRLGQVVDLIPDWEHSKLAVMALVLQIKFSEGSNLAMKLAATDPAELVESNHWNDRFWGVDTIGENWLGRLLMIRRSQLWWPPAP